MDRGGITAVLPAAGSRTRASASNALSAISVSASIVGSRWFGSDQIVCLAAGQKEVDRVAQSVDHGVDLGAQSAARAPDGLILWAPALCWWARTMVLSIIAYSLSASAARC